MISFVILHYQAIHHTLKCISNIEQYIDTEYYHIVVVDNNSPDKSGELLEKQFKDSSKITVIKCDNNLGFARGNNIGFEYSKNTLKADYIVLLNSDTRILVRDFYKSVNEEYHKNNSGVIGPLILRGNGDFVCNPMRMQPLNYKQLNAMINDHKHKLWGLSHGITGSIYMRIYKLYFKIYSKLHRMKNGNSSMVSDKSLYLVYQNNIVLHGCFMIFTPKYIESFDGLDDRTFMYGEEDLLYERCYHNDIKIAYLPKLIIYHYEGASTEVGKESRKKKIFFYENTIKSMMILKKDMEENGTDNYR